MISAVPLHSAFAPELVSREAAGRGSYQGYTLDLTIRLGIRSVALVRILFDMSMRMLVSGYIIADIDGVWRHRLKVY